jgi:hypothetical protein
LTNGSSNNDNDNDNDNNNNKAEAKPFEVYELADKNNASSEKLKDNPKHIDLRQSKEVEINHSLAKILLTIYMVFIYNFFISIDSVSSLFRPINAVSTG